MLNLFANSIKGKIIFLPEACFSGNFVTKAASCKASNRITVISAANEEEGSNNTWFFGTLGRYTDALARGIGIDYIHVNLGTGPVSYSHLLPDGKGYGNSDGKVTLRELYNYITACPGVKETGQSPMFYPANENLVLFQK